MHGGVLVHNIIYGIKREVPIHSLMHISYPEPHPELLVFDPVQNNTHLVLRFRTTFVVFGLGSSPGTSGDLPGLLWETLGSPDAYFFLAGRGKSPSRAFPWSPEAHFLSTGRGKRSSQATSILQKRPRTGCTPSAFPRQAGGKRPSQAHAMFP